MIPYPSGRNATHITTKKAQQMAEILPTVMPDHPFSTAEP
jgi:hypothetical protein